jgi:hypothetical protein
MANPQNYYQPIFNAFPRAFDFYDLGPVQLQEPEESRSEEDAILGIAFRIHGDFEAWMIVLVDTTLDLSTYSELANILASKIATHLNTADGLGVMISPPQILEPLQLAQIKKKSSPVVKRNYSLFHKQFNIPIEIWVMPTSQEVMGNA